MLQVAIYLFDGITALDAVGPFESISRSREVQVTFVGRQAGPVRTGNQALALIADQGIEDIQSADVLIMPGGVSIGVG
jgi:putative intracellular protease/amidase